MKNTHYKWAIRLAVASLIATKVVAESDHREDDNDRLSVSARFGFNIKARFENSGIGALPVNPPPRQTPGDANRPGGDAYNYDNGYILPDISGSSDGLTWYWGYDNSFKQVNSSVLSVVPNPVSASAPVSAPYNSSLPDNSILLSRTTSVSGGFGSQSLDNLDPSLGFEITYNHEFGREDRLRYGLEAAFNYMNICEGTSGASASTATVRTDAYQYFPGTVPPGATANSPYQQTYSGPLLPGNPSGFLVSNTVAGSLISSSTAVVAGHYDFQADIFGFRLGPYLEYSLGKRACVALSGGFAMDVVYADASWTEAAISASGNHCDAQWGGYVAANLSYQISRRWSAIAGVQWQDLSTYSQNLGSKKVELDMSNTFFVTLGLSYNF